jgi:TATA-binding protein-associated factor Taf7
MGYHHDAATLRRSAEKARQQMDGAWNPDMRERFEAIAMQLDHEAAAIERGMVSGEKVNVLI